MVQQGDNDSVSTAQPSRQAKTNRSERRTTNLGLVPQLVRRATGYGQQQTLAGDPGRRARVAFVEFLTLTLDRMRT